MLLKLLFFFFAGVFSWTFAEYFLHNFVGHLGKGKNHFSREHLSHHANPNYFVPTAKKVMTALAVIPVIFIFTFPFFGFYPAISYTSGFIIFYAIYEVLHRRIHTHAPIGRYGRWLRKHHLYHHFAPKKNHGVTSPFWDYVFGTHFRPGRVKVLAKNPVVWLFDQTGQVRKPYLGDYELIEGRNRS